MGGEQGRGLFGRRFAQNLNLPTKNVALSHKLSRHISNVLIVALSVSIPGLPPSEFGERRCVCVCVIPFFFFPFSNHHIEIKGKERRKEEKKGKAREVSWYPMGAKVAHGGGDFENRVKLFFFFPFLRGKTRGLLPPLSSFRIFLAQQRVMPEVGEWGASEAIRGVGGG